MPYPWYFPIIFKIWRDHWARFTDIKDTTAFAITGDSTMFADTEDAITFTEVRE